MCVQSYLFLALSLRLLRETGLKCFVRKENRSRASPERELANICKGHSYKKSVLRVLKIAVKVKEIYFGSSKC